jgi:pimeloyl-ACP methyl ester carboxylesterase
MDVIEVSGRRIAFRRSGSGPPVLFLHGGWSDSREWRLQMEALSDEFDVVAWDAPGCGGSDDLPTGAGMAGYADAVAGLVAALDLGLPHLVGLSFGGGLALAVYERHPDLASSLVLASAYAGWAGSLPQDEIDARLDRMRTDVELPPQQWVESYLPSFFAGPVPPEIRDEVVAMMLESRPAGVRPMVEAFAAADLRPVLPRVEVPTLLLYGEADSRAPRPVADALAAGIPGSELVVIPDVGHCAHLEAPEEFTTELRRFLRSASS